MRIVKTVSLFTIIMVGMSSVSYGASMTSQIRRLMQEKEEKIKTLEQCDGKRKGWMIAGISTIGLTAVGVGVNIAQASKSNKLSNEIDSAKQELDRYEYKLSDINARIADKERERAEKAKNANDTPADESDDETVIQSDQSPELDPDHPNIGDECYDGAGRWVEKAAAFGICIKGTGSTPCECVSDANLTKPKIDELPLKDKPKEPTVKPDARVVGADCLKTDLSTGATKGHYITFGINNLDCVDKAGKSVKCACAAQVCDESNGYKLVRNAQGNSQGRCQKTKANNLTKSEKAPTAKVSDDSKTSTDNKPVKKTENKSEPKQVENTKSVEQTNKHAILPESISRQQTTNDSPSNTNLSGNMSPGPTGANSDVSKTQDITDTEKKLEDSKTELETSRPGPTNAAYQEAKAEKERIEAEVAGKAAADKYFENLKKYGISPQQVNKTDNELNPAYR